MVNFRVSLLWNIVLFALVLTYDIFMLLFLYNVGTKCDRYLSKRDTQFRKAALIVTWIATVLTGIGLLSTVIALLAGARQTVGGSYGYTALPSSPMSFY